MSDLNRDTSLVLRAGTVIGIGLMVIGLLFHSFDFSDDILWAGTAVLICTPMAGVAVSIFCLNAEKDRRWTGVALVLVAAIAIGLVLTQLFGI